jgi:parallel beta-helix repeat protein
MSALVRCLGAPSHTLQVYGTGVTQVRFGNAAAGAGGGYLASNSAAQALVVGGAEFTSAWTARATSSSAIYLDAGYFYLVSNSGLTPGNSFSPTVRFQIDPSGVAKIPGLGGSGSGFVAVANDGTLSFASGSGGLPSGGAKSDIIIKNSATTGDASFYSTGVYAGVYGVSASNPDNTAAITNALSAAGAFGVVYLPPGILYHTGSITIPYSNSKLVGCGMGVTYLIHVAAEGNPNIVISLKDDVTISDMTIHHNSGSSNCINALQSQRTRIHRCQLAGATSAVGLTQLPPGTSGSHYSEVKDCEILNSGVGHGVVVSLSHGVQVVGNKMFNIGFAGVNNAASNYTVISNNYIVGTNNGLGYGGIRLTPGNNCTVTGNTIHNTSTGITIGGGLCNTITGNTIDSTDYQSILVQYNGAPIANANFNLIAHNTLRDPYITGTGAAIEITDHGVADGAQGNTFGTHVMLDTRGPVHTTKVFLQSLGASISYPNKFDTVNTNSNITIGP